MVSVEAQDRRTLAWLAECGMGRVQRTPLAWCIKHACSWSKWFIGAVCFSGNRAHSVFYPSAVLEQSGLLCFLFLLSAPICQNKFLVGVYLLRNKNNSDSDFDVVCLCHPCSENRPTVRHDGFHTLAVFCFFAFMVALNPSVVLLKHLIKKEKPVWPSFHSLLYI